MNIESNFINMIKGSYRIILPEPYHKKIKINRTYDIPFLAGPSIDNKTVYIDWRIPVTLNIDGVLFDSAYALAIHELVEKPLMEKGEKYLSAHHAATLAEKDFIYSLAQENHKNPKQFWNQYEAMMRGYIKSTELEKVNKVPNDLFIKPYEEYPDFLNKIKKAKTI